MLPTDPASLFIDCLSFGDIARDLIAYRPRFQL